MWTTTGRKIVILGGGGTAAEFAEAAVVAGNEVLGMLKDDSKAESWPILGAMPDWAALPADVLFFCGFGSAASHRIRLDVLARLAIPPHRYATIVHPQASVSPSAILEAGTGVLAFASIGAQVRVGAHVEVLQSCIVGHDSWLEDGVLLAGGANLASHVQVGRGVYIGAGACVRNGVRVGAGALIGMNATVLGDVAADAVVAGTPAVPIASRASS